MCFTEKRTNVDEPMALSPNTTPAGYGPAQIQSAYDLPSITASPLVAIVDAFDDPNAASDLAVYRSQYGLPACTPANGCFQNPTTPPTGAARRAASTRSAVPSAGSYPLRLPRTCRATTSAMARVSWMSLDRSQFTVAPGQSVTVTVTADSSVESQPGTYQADIVATANTPYASLAPVAVTMTVTPLKNWGKITGTVSDASGSPIAGATVAICTTYSIQTGQCGPRTYTLKSDGNGHYQQWLNKGFNPLEVIAAKDGYTPVLKIAKITNGGTTITNFSLVASSSNRSWWGRP